ncbi:MAG: hypothetical protein FWG88_01345 [Oscillospiraceae bacterium]|nr:hypothetical protein [Oscillospiraceae bacterium]
MKYERPKYQDPSIKVKKTQSTFGGGSDVPVPDYPISAIENFRRAAKRDNPIWVPNSMTDLQSFFTRGPLFGEQSGVVHVRDLKNGDRYIDWFGGDWTWVSEAGGPMLTPGTSRLDDITKWETELKFPDISSLDWKSQAEDFMENRYDPDKAMCVNIGPGCTERLVAILDGYGEAMSALAIEPEAVLAFFHAYADFFISAIDRIYELFPVDMVTMHDDWGTEREAFFSEKMMEELVFEPTKKIVQHVKSKGGIFELHSCGNVTRFVPYMIDMGIDFMQLQRRAVDVPKLKELYGDKIGVNAGGLEGVSMAAPLTNEQYLEALRKTVDIYAKGGGYITSTMRREPEELWDAIFELYCYSREYYENE